MKTFTKRIFLLLLTLTGLLWQTAQSQSTMSPTDPLVTYDPNNPPPAQPAYGSPDYYKIRQWVRTRRFGNPSWADSYKAYIYKGAAFRLKFPKSYVPGVSDGKTYPLIIMMHGKGEVGPITDNEYQLYHGGEIHKNWVDNGQFDGYVLFMQTSSDGWGAGYYAFLSEIIDYMALNNKLDRFRVAAHGLSAGGSGVWDMTTAYPTYIAAALPMSAAGGYNPVLKFTPIWRFNGGLDANPAPQTCVDVNNAFAAAGANFKATFYPNKGHDVWNDAYADPGFLPYILKAYLSNPWPVSGRTEFCPSDLISVTIGVRAGFDEYQWRKNGVVYARVNRNQITVDDIGTYDCRMRLGTNWSKWSPIPVVIKRKAPTVSPTITISGLMSKVIPALDGNTGVTLAVPAGYASYAWKRTGNATILDTDNTFSAQAPGSYQVKVTEQFGCSSDFSSPFTIVDANGPNKPDAAQHLIVSTISNSSLRLDWSDNPTPNFNETGFEIYQGTQPGGPYKLIAITAANVTSYAVNGLSSNVKYYYKVRAVNNTGAAASSNEGSGTTSADVLAPAAPGNLRIVSTTKGAISVAWDASIDDAAISAYYLYINGQKAYVVDSVTTSFVATGLQSGVSYAFTVRAVDVAGNLSSPSNQVSSQALYNGLNYKHYTGSFDVLPDFNALTPVATGNMPNVAITPRVQNDNFAFIWEGFITIPTTGTYYFRTNSDDGSRLYLGALEASGSPYVYGAPSTVNNDGLHGNLDSTSVALSLTAGVYPIAITFFEKGGGEGMTVSWRTPASGSSFVTIPNSAFAFTAPNLGTAPTAPSVLTANTASYNKINLGWVDNSNNETGFEIYRSKTQASGYNVVALVAPNATSYSDSALEANTTYYYQIRAIGQFGESALVSNIGNGIEAQWGFNNVLTDGSGNGRTLTGTGTPGFDAADKMEGTHAVTLNGTSQNLTIPNTSSYLQNIYTQKTIAFWAKSANNTGDRFLLDIGSNDDGLGLRLNANRLYAGAASNNTRKSIDVAFTSAAWTHIALVYNVNSLKLYINGVEAVADNALTFTSINATSGTARIGFGDAGTSGNGNVFTISSPGRFSGKMDNMGIYNRALSTDEIARLAGSQPLLQSFAATQVLPAAPAVPAGLLATAVSASSVNVTWNDVAGEKGYQLYKSNNNNSNYILFATLDSNTISFADQDLFANAIYYYKVKAIGEGGASAFSNEDSAKTKNTAPVMDNIKSRSARYGITTKMNISATDPDGDALTFSSPALPGFITITNNGDRTATLTLNPTLANQGVQNIDFIVNDGNGGKDTATFTLTVSDNYDPTIDSVGNYTVDENGIVNIPLSGVDQNAANTLTWSVLNLPDAFTITPLTNRTATLAFNPKYGTKGNYTITVNTDDAMGGSASRTFTVTVLEKDPNTQVYLRIQSTAPAPAPWNNITGAATSNLKDIYNQTTTIGLNFPVAGYFHTIPWGPVTGDNSGVYPDVVIKDNLYIGETWEVQPLIATLTGLNPARKYSLTFYAGVSRGEYLDTYTSNFTVNGQTVSLKFKNNTQNTVTLEDLVPAADGSLNISIIKGGGAPLAFLNSIIIKSTYEDGTVPAGPTGLVALTTPTGEVSLSWHDNSYNESAFEMYRSTSENSGYVKINTTKIKNNTTLFVDSTATAFSTFYYKVKAINDAGSSAFSNVFSINTGNRVPKLAAINNVTIRNNQTNTVNIVATDDLSDHVTLTVQNLPSFATFTDNGNGTGVINLTPGLGSTGRYTNILVTATDNSNAVVSTAFEVTITDKDVTAMYVSFSDGGFLANAPWNNFAAWPGAGANMSNIKDENGVVTSVGLTLVDGFDGVANYGVRPGNGTTIYEEQATRGAYLIGSANTKTIKVTGLSTSKVYNFVFFNSVDYGANGTTVFTIGAKNVTLNASYNANKTVQINGVAPNGSGEVTITVKKQAGADMAVINTLVIQGYAPALDLLSPSNLRISNIQKNKLSLQWEDRSFAETGFQIWRATSAQGSYSLLTTTAADVTSYTDQNLSPNKTYYYLVRAAKGGSTFSAYTARTLATTYAHTLYVNFTSIDIAPSPWNNTEATPEEGFEFGNFKFDDNALSTIEMKITRSFSEIQPLGMNTGNNSGFFPDNVIKKTYCVFPGTTGEFKLSGLNLGFEYDITLFGSQSQIVTLDATSVYVINGKRYIHNSARNLGSGNVIAYGIVPDQNGEIYISVARESATSLGGYLCGIIVSGNMVPAESSPTLPAGARVATQGIELAASNNIADDESAVADITAYPNPFKNDVTLSLYARRDDRVMVNVYSIAGQLIYTKQFANLNDGMNTVQVALGNAPYSSIYFAHISYVNRKLKNKVIKLIRKQ